MNKPVDKLRETPNPYDFANPVSEEKQFIGRTNEISDLIYYLNHATATSKPIHLAIIGERAAGKTSFLNIADIEAARRDFCCVRINLNEGDVASDLNFFRKIFHSILMAAFNSGAFGGRRGKTYFAYADLSARGSIDDIEQMPFICAIMIATAMRERNDTFHVPDDLLAEDLVLIQQEVKKPFIILIDECNVLRENRIILEKLRNIFMNMTGYMLVFAATEDFFPVMDKVFSPIMRQFKKIDIGAFKSDDDVRQCVRKPLERTNLTEDEQRALTPEMFISDVTDLTSRKPYEIQLVCHELFKRCQEGQSKRFTLNLQTLEAIRQVLARGQNVDDRPIIRKATRMKSNLLQVLEACCGGVEHLSLQETWRMEYLLHGASRWSEEAYKRQCEELLELGIVKRDDVGISFCGDQFDRIYLKYLAKSKNASLSMSNHSIEDWFFLKLSTTLSKIEGLNPVSGVGQRTEPIDVEKFISWLSDGAHTVDNDLLPFLDGLITHLMYQDAGSTIRLYEIRFRSDLASGQIWLSFREPEHLAGLKKVRREVELLIERGNHVGIEIESLHWDIVVPSLSEVCELVIGLNDEQFSTRISNELMEMVQFFYVRGRNKKRALESAEAAYFLHKSRLHSGANNVGYLYLDKGDLNEAELWLSSAIQYGDTDDSALANYNLGVTHLKKHSYDEAASWFSKTLAAKDLSAACLHKISVNENGDFITEEVLSPGSVNALASEAIALLNEYSPQTQRVH